jgi:transcriptional regulator with XRE-family HTH domain
MDLPTTIRTARRASRLSQRTVAQKLGVAPSAVAQWETGETKPKLSNRVDLAQLLTIPFSDLLPEYGGEGGSQEERQKQQFLAIFEKLPPPVRESLLMQAAATAEAIEAAAKPPPSK